MDSPDVFQKNIERWSPFCPVAAQILPSFANIEANLPKELSLSEAEAWAETVNCENIEVLFVYGLQKYAPYAVLKAWCVEENRCLVILESDLEVIAQFFKTNEAEELLNNSHVWLYHLDPLHRALDDLAKLFATSQYSVTTVYSDEQRTSITSEIRAKIDFFHNMYASIIAENKNHGLVFYENYLHNLYAWPKAFVGNCLYNQFQGVPAIICGAGPSLAKNVEVLKTLKEHALIFGGGSAMNALNAAGMTPHLGTGIDPNQEYLKRIVMNDAFEIPFIFRGRMCHKALNLVNSDKLYITGSSGYQISDYFEKACHITGENIEEGCNVVTFGVQIATAMGCNPIILVGVDLAYSGEQSYAPGMVSHPIHKHFRTKIHNEELIFRKDINGEVVPTLWKWVTEAIWFTTFAATHPQITLINSTEGGLGFSGVPNISLVEVAKQYLKEPQGIATRLWGEIQKSRMPPEVTEAKITELARTLQESLVRAHQKLLESTEELTEILNAERSVSLSFEEFTASLNKKRTEKISGEESYAYLLKTSDNAFDLFKGREFKRLSCDHTLLPRKEWQRRLVELELERASFLLHTAAIQANLINNVIAEEEYRIKKETEKFLGGENLPLITDESTYKYENHHLNLEDTACDLHLSEEFIPRAETGVIKLYDDKKHLKFESYRNSLGLHGPTRFYGENGSLLAESWYVDGLQEGKALTYTNSGALHSIQRYKRGNKFGVQEYYYEDGTARLTLNYREDGLLDGEVVMYYPNGRMARKLGFAKGKRQGGEYVWNGLGVLLVEAHFNEGHPVGTAKIWYPNGQLAQETVYNDDSEVIDARVWNSGGVIVDEANGKEDYFQEVAKKSKILTESLKTVFKEISVLAPLLDQTSNRGNSSSGALSEDLQGLVKELSTLGDAIGHLQKMGEELLAEANLDQKNRKESFWKTAGLQREVEQKLREATEDMQKKLGLLRSTLALTMEKIQEKNNSSSTAPFNEMF